MYTWDNECLSKVFFCLYAKYEIVDAVMQDGKSRNIYMVKL